MSRARKKKGAMSGNSLIAAVSLTAALLEEAVKRTVPVAL